MTAQSRIGHGATGFRDRMVGARDLMRLAGWRKECYLQLRPGRLLSNDWTEVGDSDGWVQEFSETFRGKILDVVALRASFGAFVRVESLDEIEGNPFTFHYDAVNPFPLITINPGPNNPNDADKAMVAVLLITIGTTAAVHPELGPEMLTNGSLDDWTTDTNLADWTEDLSGGGVITKEETWIREGVAAAAFSGSAPGDFASFHQDVATQLSSFILGQRIYRLSGWYGDEGGDARRGVDEVSHLNIRLGDTASTEILFRDGRNIDPDSPATDGMVVRRTGGNWRRFLFDFIPSHTTTRLTFEGVIGNNVDRRVVLDGLSMRRVFGWHAYEPRIVIDSFPSIQIGSDSVWPGTNQFGTATFKIANDAAWVEELIARFDWEQAEVHVYQGGQVINSLRPNDLEQSASPEGARITFDDLVFRFRGYVRAFTVDDGEGSLEVADANAIFSAELPLRRFNTSDTPDAPSIHQGQPRAIVYGPIPHVAPSRVGLTVPEGFGIYEAMDPGPGGIYVVNPNRFGLVTAAWSYTDDDAAARRDPARRIDVSGDVTDDILDDGLVTVASNIRVFEVLAGKNDIGDFDAGGGPIIFTLTPALYIASGAGGTPRLVVEAQTQLNISSTGFTVTYDETTHLVTVANATPFTVLLSAANAPNRDRSAWRLLGFTGDVDLGPGTTFTGTTPLLADVDREHILRLDMTGVYDDNLGTFTGISESPIQLAPDILSHILQRIIKYPIELIDLASAAAARSYAGQVLGVYLGGRAAINGGDGFTKTLRGIISTLASGAFVDVVIDGTGRVGWRNRNVIGASAVPDVSDRDYLLEPRFAGFKDPEEVYSTLRVNFLQDPVTGYVQAVERFLLPTLMRFQRPQARTLDTFLTDVDDVIAVLLFFEALAKQPLRRFRFTTKNRLHDKLPGDVITAVRSQGIGLPGSPTEVDGAFRISSIGVNYLTMEVVAEVHEQVEPEDPE